jgi:hypothetical protein
VLVPLSVLASSCSSRPVSRSGAGGETAAPTATARTLPLPPSSQTSISARRVRARNRLERALEGAGWSAAAALPRPPRGLQCLDRAEVPARPAFGVRPRQKSPRRRSGSALRAMSRRLGPESPE